MDDECDYTDATVDLMRWFQSQEIDKTESCAVMLISREGVRPRSKGRTSQPNTTPPFGHTNHRPRRRFMINPVALAPVQLPGLFIC
jgi:hypothetical protein